MSTTGHPRDDAGRSIGPAGVAADAAALRIARTVPVDHPAFAGHFPGQPLLPGVLLLAEVMEALQGAPALAARLGSSPGVASAKFLAPVRPGDAITVGLFAAGAGLRFEVHRGDVLAASGQLLPEGAG